MPSLAQPGPARLFAVRALTRCDNEAIAVLGEAPSAGALDLLTTLAQDPAVAEEAYSRIRLTPSVFFEEGEATDYKLRVNAKIRVPRMSKRLRLVIGDTSEDEESVLTSETFPAARQSENDSTAIGLQYFVKTNRNADFLQFIVNGIHYCLHIRLAVVIHG